jgi:hypothetical protein
LGELGIKAVLTEDLFVVGLGDADKIVELGLYLRIPVLIIVQELRGKVIAV